MNAAVITMHKIAAGHNSVIAQLTVIKRPATMLHFDSSAAERQAGELRFTDYVCHVCVEQAKTSTTKQISRHGDQRHAARWNSTRTTNCKPKRRFSDDGKAFGNRRLNTALIGDHVMRRCATEIRCPTPQLDE
jgi:hypothetical protein